jgi:hypothetical protein
MLPGGAPCGGRGKRLLLSLSAKPELQAVSDQGALPASGSAVGSSIVMGVRRMLPGGGRGKRLMLGADNSAAVQQLHQ